VIEVGKIKIMSGKGNFKGYVEIKIDDITIRSCSIMDGKNGLFVTMPSKKGGDEWYPIVTLHDNDLKTEVNSAVIGAYHQQIVNEGESVDQQQPSESSQPQQENPTPADQLKPDDVAWDE